MVCLPMYFLGDAMLKEVQTVSTCAGGDDELCMLIKKIILNTKYISHIDKIIGSQSS